jgi:hypothetical protein
VEPKVAVTVTVVDVDTEPDVRVAEADVAPAAIFTLAGTGSAVAFDDASVTVVEVAAGAPRVTVSVVVWWLKSADGAMASEDSPGEDHS